MTDVPKYMILNTGEYEAYETIDGFFDSVRKGVLEMKLQGPGPTSFEIRVRGLHNFAPEIIPSDDKLHMLLYYERVVAVVTETRTEFNHVRYDFFKNLEDLADDMF